VSIESSLMDKYAGSTVDKAGETLFQRTVALQLVADCERQGVTIVGMDFWIEGPKGIQEVTGGSADYSSLSGRPDAPARSTAAARALLEKGLPDGATHVSFVLSEG